MPAPAKLVRFGLFELDPGQGSLLKGGRRIKLQEQPFRLLSILLERAGETVTREELRQALWTADTFVDFDRGLNAAMAKLRQALGDSAENPRFIETHARRGYRFIAPTEKKPRTDEIGIAAQNALSLAAESFVRPQAPGKSYSPLWFGIGAALLCAIGATLAIGLLVRTSHPEAAVNQITFDAGLTIDPAVSPDGKLLAYASDHHDRNLNLWVQQLVEGGTSVQLTFEHADTREPVFSPDGSHIVFHCGRNAGGICVVPTIGGPVTRLAANGSSPRMSPDGKWIAFHNSLPTSSILTGKNTGQSFVMAVDGSAVRPIAMDLHSATVPVWNPDSEHLMALSYGPAWDWFVVSRDGQQPSRASGFFPELRKQGFSIAMNRIPRLSEWQHGFVVFSATYGDATNAWRMPISKDGSPAGKAERLTLGTALETRPVLAGNGDLYFESVTRRNAIWSLPMDSDKALVRGDLKRVSQGPFDVMPSISLDGRWLALAASHGTKPLPENARVYVQDLTSNSEKMVSDSNGPEAYPHISQDGAMILTTATTANGDSATSFSIRSLEQGRPRIPQTTSGFGWDISADARRLLVDLNNDEVVQCVEQPAMKELFRIGDPASYIFQPKFSPDGRYLTFAAVPKTGVVSRLFIASAMQRGKVPAKDWIAIDNTRFWDDKPRWSPNGAILYFISNRDGHFCLWAQRLDVISKQPLDTPFAVYHFHDLAFGMESVGLGLVEIDVAQDKTVLGLGEMTGNIWSMKKR